MLAIKHELQLAYLIERGLQLQLNIVLVFALFERALEGLFAAYQLVLLDENEVSASEDADVPAILQIIVEYLDDVFVGNVPFDIAVVRLLQCLLIEAESPKPEVVFTHEVDLSGLIGEPKTIDLSLREVGMYFKGQYLTLPFEVINPYVFLKILFTLGDDEIEETLAGVVCHFYDIDMRVASELTDLPAVVLLLLFAEGRLVAEFSEMTSYL